MTHLDGFSNVILNHPKSAALLVLSVGVLGGIFTRTLVGEQFFARFRSLTVGLAIVVFGYVSSELLIAAQTARLAGTEEEERQKASRIRSALTWQTFVVLCGTIQWGFGDLIFGRAS